MGNKLAIAAALLGAVVLGVVLASFSNAQDGQSNDATEEATASSSFSDLQQQEIEDIVRDYIKANPRLILESVNAFAESERLAEEERTKEAALANIDTLQQEIGGFTTFEGKGTPEVVVVEFFDYHCSYCKKAAGNVRELTKKEKNVKFVFRELPILRKESETAARYSLAAREQDKYLDFHFKLMKEPGVLTEDRILTLAKASKLDVDALKADAASVELINEIQENLSTASRLGIDGTPTFLIASADGSFIDVIPGFAPARVKAAIEEARKATKG
ncbi:MAG: DsbA family protein [Pseudomonadota bacterium]